jgi:hypothetical protein
MSFNLLFEPEPVKREVISGKLSIRFVPSRCVYQIYAGGRYLNGASGVTHEEAWEWFNRSYSHEGK